MTQLVNQSSQFSNSATEPANNRQARGLFAIAKSASNAPLPGRRWVLLIALASVIAIGASGYLGYVALTSSKIAGCGGGKLFNCGHVISSRWSLWMGIPVSLLAVGLYVTLAGSLFVGSTTRLSNSVRHIGWAFVSVLAMSAGLAAIWFISLQVFVLNHLCTYCLVAHTCGLIIASVILYTRPIGGGALKTASVLSFVGAAILIVGQWVAEPPKTFKIETFEAPAAGGSEVFEFEAPVFEAPGEGVSNTTSKLLLELPSSFSLKESLAFVFNPSGLLAARVQENGTQEASSQESSSAQSSTADKSKATAADKSKASTTNKSTANAATPVVRRLVPINGGTVQLDVAQWPLSGSRSAKHIFVEMFDYSCPHCRHTHAAIKGASELLNGDLAVVVLPIPLSASCNNTIQVTDPKFIESCEIAKLAVAVWRVDPAKFTEFHNWMFAEAAAPTYAAAKARADALVAAEKLNAEIASQVPSQYIAKMVELYKRAGSGNVPKLIFPTTTVVGEFTSGPSLAELIKQQIK